MPGRMHFQVWAEPEVARIYLNHAFGTEAAALAPQRRKDGLLRIDNLLTQPTNSRRDAYDLAIEIAAVAAHDAGRRGEHFGEVPQVAVIAKWEER